jgi:hypothetical protein
MLFVVFIFTGIVRLVTVGGGVASVLRLIAFVQVLAAHSVGVLAFVFTIATVDAVGTKDNGKEPTDAIPHPRRGPIKKVDGHQDGYAQVKQHHEEAEKQLGALREPYLFIVHDNIELTSFFAVRLL